MLNWLEDCKGISFPWKVESFDHPDAYGLPRPFCLKYFRQGDLPKALVEFLCGSIAHELDIGAPELEILNVTNAFLRPLATFTKPPRGLALAVPGHHVGIAWVEGAAELARHPNALDGLANVRQPAEIIGCDTCLQNDDRHDGNVLLHPAAIFGRADHKLIPIDWGASFLGYNPRSFVGTRLAREMKVRRVTQASSLKNVVRGVDDFTDLLKKLGAFSADPARVREIINRVPASWGVSSNYGFVTK